MDQVIDIPTAFSEALIEVGRAYENVVVLDADIADSCKTEGFHEAFPERAPRSTTLRSNAVQASTKSSINSI